ncbi:MAG: GNAT family N-acetyltransferase [Nocardioides sp.]|nr:GNAT family N-acetyltransferase [Nocardioides sp.]
MSVTDPLDADVLLSDGSVAVVRGVRSSDQKGLLALHDGASLASLRMRFFVAGRKSGHDYVEHLFDVEQPTVASLVVTVHDRIVALGTAEPVSADTAEIAFLVDEETRGHGLGSLLLEHLAAACRDRGIRRFVAEVLPENRAMLGVLLSAGFEIARKTEDGTVHVELGIAASARAVTAADARESRAETRSLAPLLYPRSVAVTGVRRDGTGIGAAVLSSIQAGGYAGSLHVVHPSGVVVEGLASAARFTDLPGTVDLAIVAVPAARVLDTLRDAAVAGIPAAVVISSGFDEMGAEGSTLQRAILDFARAHSMRLVGPNCLGVMSNGPGIRLNATFSHAVPPPGGLAIASQSGGVGIVLLDLARDLGLGVGSFISLGNKADVSGNDLLAAWLEDPQVTAAALYLESCGNAPKFARVARRFAERKPLLAVVGGRSSGGRRAGASHTAAAAASGVGVDALFAQAGVIGCHSAEEIAETALLLGGQPLPLGPRIAVVSNAGGLGVLAADEADDSGLVVPELSGTLRAKLATHVRGTTGVSNPVDAGAATSADDLGSITTALLDSNEVDAVVVVLVRTSVADPAPLVTALAACRAMSPHKPLLLVTLGGLEPSRDALSRITRYRSVTAAIHALSRVTGYAAWLRVPREPVEPPNEDRAATARAVGSRFVTNAHADGWLDLASSVELLDAYGLTPVGRSVRGGEDAGRAAREIGFPVVVKIAEPGIVHKTDRGLVRVGLDSYDEVITAVHDFGIQLGHDATPVLVQPVVSGVELALGVVRDPGFGPLVMVAAGGVTTDLLADRVFLLPPLTRGDAGRALRSLRSWPLLDGFRGTRRVDVGALEQLIVSLGALATDVPEIAELDLNPVVVTPSGCSLVDVKVRLATAAPLDAGIPRQLRRPR